MKNFSQTLKIIKITVGMIACGITAALPLEAKTTEYDINIEYKTVNYTGKEVQAMTVGGTIPAPTIEAIEGDTLRVTFHNKMDVETSIHWHGIILPNDQDGVPYLTTMPIHANSSFTYKYPVKQSGTYWYHSHTGLQEQRGVYGALVFHPRTPSNIYDREMVVVFSDWTDENPNSVLRHLKAEPDYYSLKKGTVQSWLKVLQHGPKAIKQRFKNSWTRMGAMDLSDVGYDVFLANGLGVSELGPARAGEKILLRIVNASSSTYFNVQFGGGQMSVVSADGVDVEPVMTDRFPIAVAETYDVIVTIPENKSYELRATSVDGSGFAAAFLGEGERVKAPDIPRPDIFTMDHSAHGGHGAHVHHAGMKMEKNLSYDDLKARQKTTLPSENPTREITLRLTGNMETYTWSFDDKILEEADKILIRKGENVRFILKNETMMNHPIHLHGHFFRVLNKQGDYSPLKHTVDVKAMDTTTIEFLADQEKDWLFHCHILYHMMSGMARIIHYEGSSVDPKLAAAMKGHHPHEEHSMWYAWGQVSPQSNLVNGAFKITGHKYFFETEWDNNYKGEYDVEPRLFRKFSRFFDVFAGGEFERDHSDKIENVATWGFRYVLPFLIEAEYRLDHRGGQQIGFHSKLQLTDRLEAHGAYELTFHFEKPWAYSEFELEHDYRAELEYRVTKNFSLVGNYDSDHRGGGGVRFRF